MKTFPVLSAAESKLQNHNGNSLNPGKKTLSVSIIGNITETCKIWELPCYTFPIVSATEKHNGNSNSSFCVFPLLSRIMETFYFILWALIEIWKQLGRPSFLGMEIIRNGSGLDTKVYRKRMDTGLLLHYRSHIDMKCKHSPLKTVLNRAFKLSSNWQFFCQECERLKENFTHLHYPEALIQTTIRSFVEIKGHGEHTFPAMSIGNAH